MRRLIIVAIMVSFLIPGVVFASARSAKITFIDGSVELQRSEGVWETAVIGIELGRGDKLKTGRGSFAEIEFEDKGNIKLNEETVMSVLFLDEVGPAKEKVGIINLISGQIRVKTVKVKGRDTKFEVQTPSCMAGTQWAEFIIGNEAGFASDAQVIDGVVLMEGIDAKGERGAPVELKPGLSTLVERSKAPMQPQRIENYNKSEWRLWDQRKKICNMEKESGLKKEEFSRLHAVYGETDTVYQKKMAGKLNGLNKNITRLDRDMETAKSNFKKDKENFDREVSKVIEKWKKLAPGQRFKAGMRMDYRIWRCLNY